MGDGFWPIGPQLLALIWKKEWAMNEYKMGLWGHGRCLHFAEGHFSIVCVTAHFVSYLKTFVFLQAVGWMKCQMWNQSLTSPSRGSSAGVGPHSQQSSWRSWRRLLKEPTTPTSTQEKSWPRGPNSLKPGSRYYIQM